MEPMSDSPVCPNLNSVLEKPVEVPLQEWLDSLQLLQVTRVDMNRLIMNYLVTEGFKEAADKFRMESGVEPMVDLDTLDERLRIREAIQEGRIQEAIALINELHPELLDTNNHLYFHLLQQHTIELIRAKQVAEALDFAQTHLAEKGMENGDMLPEIECTLALLAFEKPETSPYGELLQPSQRQKVASEVNSALLLAADSRDSSSRLANLLKLLLWAQDELDSSKAKYPKMSNLVSGKLDEPK
jgi:hypothetical protein